GQAEQARGQAEQARGQAEQARGQAEGAQQQERKAREQAEQAHREVAGARDRLAAKQEELDQVLYLRRVSLAHAEWRDGEVARAEQALQECPRERRHWEWRYVHHLCHADLLTFRGHKGWVSSVCFSPDGKRLASAGQDRTVRVWDAQTGQETLPLKGHT